MGGQEPKPTAEEVRELAALLYLRGDEYTKRQLRGHAKTPYTELSPKVRRLIGHAIGDRLQTKLKPGERQRLYEFAATYGVRVNAKQTSDAPRDKSMNLRVNQQEKDVFQIAANQAGMSLSDYVRSRALRAALDETGLDPIPEEESAAQ